MKKILGMMIVLSIGFVLSSTAQIRKIPAEVTNAFSEKYPEARDIEWKDNLSAFVVSFEKDGENLEARFNKKGEWQSTEKLIEADDLPGKVEDGFEKSKYSDWEVKSIYRIELPQDELQYRLRVAKSDIQQRNLLFNEKGRLLKDKITL